MKTSEQILMALQLCKRNSCSKSCSYHGERACYVKLHSDAAILIRQLEPVRHGRWIPAELRKSFGTLNGVKCSLCDKERMTRENYCPKCGAKMMDGDANAQEKAD